MAMPYMRPPARSTPTQGRVLPRSGKAVMSPLPVSACIVISSPLRHYYVALAAMPGVAALECGIVRWEGGRADVITCTRMQGFNHTHAGALYMCPPAAVIVPP